MINEIKRYISENNLVKQGDKILLAVSGGIDSMVMANLFLNLDYSISIAHCNFGLRGTESDKDEAMVSNFAITNDLAFHVKHFETRSYAGKKGISIQMAARDLRYEWFEQLVAEYGYKSVAVAHNLNDNAETLLINLTRGTGIAGLSGIRPSSGNIIRPLLFASRSVIQDYCTKNSVVYREDRSNADTKYIRNKIRHKVLPILREINPSIDITLNDTAERISDINEIVNEYITRLREKVIEQNDEAIIFNISLLKEQLHNKAVLYELFRPYGITGLMVNDLVKVINGNTGGQLFTESHRIIKNRKEILVSAEGADQKVIYIIKTISDFGSVPGITSASIIEITGSFEIPSDPFQACVDLEKITFPMTIRKWKAGDYFYPLGMKHKKKLSNYFIDSKYSRLDKENKLILESAGKIVWIIGDRIDNRFRIDSSSKNALLIKATKKALRIIPVK